MTVDSIKLEMAIAKLRRFRALLLMLSEHAPASDYGEDTFAGLSDAVDAIYDDFQKLREAREKGVAI